jgi:2-polyprenyl-6-methoxyphenol hydroxylase-like FAD-dependent oxidoreductase
MGQRIAIVGAGTAGLHLGLYSQQKPKQLSRRRPAVAFRRPRHRTR